jgi:hypothetical protein
MATQTTSFFDLPGILGLRNNFNLIQTNPRFLPQQNMTPGLVSTNTTGSNNGEVTDNKNETPQNIFGERLAQALFPGISQNNKQLIDAAILRGSLELLKPRQAGENLASQLGRGLEAGVKVGQDVQKRNLERLATEATLAKAQQGRQVTVSKEKRKTFESAYDSLLDTNPSFKRAVDKIAGLALYGDDDLKDSVILDSMVYNANTGGSPTQAMIAIVNRLSGTSNAQTTTQGQTDKFADRKIKVRNQ